MSFRTFSSSQTFRSHCRYRIYTLEIQRFKQFLMFPFQTGKGGLYNLISPGHEYIWRRTSRMVQNADFTKYTKVQGCFDKKCCSCCSDKISIVRSSTTAKLYLTPSTRSMVQRFLQLVSAKRVTSQRGEGWGLTPVHKLSVKYTICVLLF